MDCFILCRQWRTEGGGGGLGGFNPPPPRPKFRRLSKIMPNSTRLWKLLKMAEFRMPAPQDVRKKGSKILKLPPVRSCVTLAVTNKLVVIVNSLKVPKIKKILLYEMKFIVPNYSCLQNPWLGGYRPQIPVLSVLCPQLNLLNPPPPLRTKSLGTPLSVDVVATLPCVRDMAFGCNVFGSHLISAAMQCLSRTTTGYSGGQEDSCCYRFPCWKCPGEIAVCAYLSIPRDFPGRSLSYSLRNAPLKTYYTP